MKSIVISLLLISVVSACAYRNPSLKEDLSTRASFEFDCEKSMMSYTPLKTEFDGIISSYGVKGCEKKAVYVWVNGIWVLNSKSN
jgi:hypothetical protein